MENDLKKLITVVIPAYNEENNIERCLSSVISQNISIEKIEIIVVDHASTDNTKFVSEKILSDFNCGRVLYKDGGTIAAVRNFGAKVANGKFLAFLDADSIVDPDWLTIGLKILCSDDAISCVGFAVAPPCAGAGWVQRTWYLISSSGKRKGTVDVDWLSSFNLILRKNMFERIGGFDESLKTCEDSDLGLRLSAVSRLVFSDRCCVRHLGAVSSLSEFIKKEFWRGQNAFEAFLKTPKNINKIFSIFVPLAYVLNFIMLIVVVIFMFFTSKYYVLFSLNLFCLFLMPIAMSIRAGVGMGSCLFNTAILHIFYLIARGGAIVRFRKQ